MCMSQALGYSSKAKAERGACSVRDLMWQRVYSMKNKSYKYETLQTKSMSWRDSHNKNISLKNNQSLCDIYKNNFIWEDGRGFKEIF